MKTPLRHSDKLGGGHDPIARTRQSYLTFMGLSFDPFLMPVAEQELAFSVSPENIHGPKKDTPLSLSYFVPPKHLTVNDSSILSALREARQAFVFGNPGMGKTSLRLALMATCRRTPAKTLAVTYLMNQGDASPVAPEVHANRINRQLVIDLFIQILEQFNPAVSTPNQTQIELLGHLFALGGRPLQRLAHQILKSPEPMGMMGVAHYWSIVDRLPVRYVHRSAELVALVKDILAVSAQHKSVPHHNILLEGGVAAAKAWGFERIFLMIDGLDTWARESEQMLALLEPLLPGANLWSGTGIVGKYFLPRSIETAVTTNLNSLSLIPEPINVSLNWNKADLSQLLAARFRVAQARRTSFNDLTHPDWQENLDQLILDHAAGSPRRLLQIVSLLIDQHILNIMQSTEELHYDDNLITEKDWQRTLVQLDQASPH